MAQRFGRFWLHEKIGHGGMAEVFRATLGPDPDTSAFDLAVKRMHPHLQKDAAQVDMFFTEADVAKFLKHPNIVQVYESGLEGGQAYIAMEYIQGYDLATLVELLRKRRLRFPSDLAVFVALSVLRALDYVHTATTPGGEAMDIVHRDVTPSNIYLTVNGEVKLGDFGIARVSFLEGADEARMLKGKVSYMPPEVLTGAVAVSQKVDLWSVAVTLWEMLTARRLFEGVPDSELMTGRFGRIEPVHHYNSDIHEKLSRILARSLAVNPKKRPEDAVAFYRELKQYLRDQGIDVDATALARFVGAVTGARTVPAVANAPKTGIFEQPAFQVPMQASPTQRFELKKRRTGRGPLLVGGAVLLLVVGGVIALTLGKGDAQQVEPSPPTAAVPTPAVDVAPAPAPAAEETQEQAVNTRPEASDEFSIEFTEELGEEFDGAPVATSQDSKARYRALMHRGRVQSQRKKFTSAAEAFAEALTLRPKDATAMLGRANALIELKKYAEAERLVRAAIKETPKNARAYLLLGDVLWILGKDKDARTAYQKTVELDPRGNVGKTAQRILGAL